MKPENSLQLSKQTQEGNIFPSIITTPLSKEPRT